MIVGAKILAASCLEILHKFELGIRPFINMQVISLFGIWSSERVVESPTFGDIPLDKELFLFADGLLLHIFRSHLLLFLILVDGPGVIRIFIVTAEHGS